MNLNIAARAGRWSAAHWKTAVSAWLVFCVVAIVLGAVAGTRLLKQADTAAGGTKTAEQMLKRRWASRTARARACSSSRRRETIADPAFRAAVADVARTVSELAAGRAGAVAARARNAGQISKNRPLGARAVRDPGRRRTKPTRRCSRCSTPSGSAQQQHPGFTVAEFGVRQLDARAEQDAEQGLPAGRVLDAAGDADHPVRCVRRARGSGAAGAARLLGRSRDDRPLGAREPCRRGR